MSWRLTDYSALHADDVSAWLGTRNADPVLDSPFYHPAYAAAVHSVFGNVHVITDGNDRRVWFPVQIRRGIASPAGSPGTDFQGPVLAVDACIDPIEMLRETGIRALRFDHMSRDRDEFAPWTTGLFSSPFIDTHGGLEDYLARVGKSGRDKMSRVRRMTNKARGRLGEVRLVWHEANGDLLDKVIAIKREQYRDTGVRDFFADHRREALLHHLAGTRSGTFAGVLSAVYAGDTMLAAHLGLRDRGVLHWWFPVYNRSQSDLAPGWILLRELIKAAPEHDVSRIDLGRGDEDYKLRSMTGAVTVREGEVAVDAVRRRLRRAQRDAISRVKSSPIGPQARRMRNRVLSLRATSFPTGRIKLGVSQPAIRHPL